MRYLPFASCLFVGLAFPSLAVAAPSFTQPVAMRDGIELATDVYDGTWDAVETADRFGQVVVPAVHYGGWYDIFTQGTIDAFVGYHAAWRSSVANKPNGCRDV